MKDLSSLSAEFREWARSHSFRNIANRPIVLLDNEKVFYKQISLLEMACSEIKSQVPSSKSYLLNLPKLFIDVDRINVWSSRNYSSKRYAKDELIEWYEQCLSIERSGYRSDRLQQELETVLNSGKNSFSIRRKSGLSCRAAIHFDNESAININVSHYGLFALSLPTKKVQFANNIRKPRSDKLSNCLIKSSLLPLNGEYEIFGSD